MCLAWYCLHIRQLLSTCHCYNTFIFINLQALTGLCEDLEDVAGLALPAHWARHFFLAALCLELQHNAEALSRLQVINQVGTMSA
jgi:hypothetical protein